MYRKVYSSVNLKLLGYEIFGMSKVNFQLIHGECGIWVWGTLDIVSFSCSCHGLANLAKKLFKLAGQVCVSLCVCVWRVFCMPTQSSLCALWFRTFFFFCFVCRTFPGQKVQPAEAATQANSPHPTTLLPTASTPHSTHTHTDTHNTSPHRGHM